MKKMIVIAAASLILVTFASCNKTSDPANSDNAAAVQADPSNPENAAAAQQIPPDPDIDPKALIGSWTQTVDDPDVYSFMEDGKCTQTDSLHKTKECTYELLTPTKAQSRFNLLIVHYPAIDNEQAYDNRIPVRITDDGLVFPDDEGNVSMYNQYKKIDPNAVKQEKVEEAPAYAGNIQEDVLGEWSEEVSDGPTVTYKFMSDDKCWFQDVMTPKGIDCTYKISPDSGNKFKLVVTREDALDGKKDFENIIEFKDGNLYFYVDDHPYKYNKK